MTTLSNVVNLQRRQSSRFKELRQNLSNKLTEKISHLAKHGELRCIYTVPSYVFGFPRYNTYEIVTYLYTILNNEGFCVIIISSDKLFISWDINDINNIKKEIKKKQNLNNLKPLLNNSI